MNKIFLTLILAVTINAQLIDGVAIVVKGKAITLLDIKKEMKLSSIGEKNASDNLIRKTLEELETQERKISVSSSEVYEDIKKTAQRNNLSVSKFYDAIRESNGLSSSELKQKIKEKLLSQKLYGAIAYSSVSQPSADEISEYYELHKDSFSHPSAFSVVIYQSKDSSRLQEKIDNPMFNSPDIKTDAQELLYAQIAPELARLLSNTAKNSFTQIVPDGKGGFMSFYLKSIKEVSESSLKSVENEIINALMSGAREQVLSDYFARLKDNAEIVVIRGLE